MITYDPGMRRGLMGWAAVLVGLGFSIAEAVLLNGRIRDFDEGVYWQSIRALARGEPLFSSVFTSQPPGFYYLLLPGYLASHSIAGLRLTVLVLGAVGLLATYAAARLMAGGAAGLMALVLAATGVLYFHQSAIVQADGPSAAISMVAVCLALLAGREAGGRGLALAAAAGFAVAMASGVKLTGALAVVPLAIVLLGANRGRARLVAAAAVGGLLGSLLMVLPAIGSAGAALDQLVLIHLRAGRIIQQSTSENLSLLLYRRELPLEALAMIGALTALLRRDRAILMPLAWAVASFAALLVYHPLFLHHVVMLSLPLAMTAAIGLAPLYRRFMPAGLAISALLLAASLAGAYVIRADLQLAMVPDLHNVELTAAVRSVSAPGEYWISDNPYAVAAADRDLPGPLVDTSSQRTRAGLLTLDILETTRARYHVGWLLEDSFRLDLVAGYRQWVNQHFHVVQKLGGGAVVYEAD